MVWQLHIVVRMSPLSQQAERRGHAYASRRNIHHAANLCIPAMPQRLTVHLLCSNASYSTCRNCWCNWQLQPTSRIARGPQCLYYTSCSQHISRAHLVWALPAIPHDTSCYMHIIRLPSIDASHRCVDVSRLQSSARGTVHTDTEDIGRAECIPVVPQRRVAVDDV